MDTARRLADHGESASKPARRRLRRGVEGSDCANGRLRVSGIAGSSVGQAGDGSDGVPQPDPEPPADFDFGQTGESEPTVAVAAAEEQQETADAEMDSTLS